jgi:hypothetical protein
MVMLGLARLIGRFISWLATGADRRPPPEQVSKTALPLTAAPMRPLTDGNDLPQSSSIAPRMKQACLQTAAADPVAWLSPCDAAPKTSSWDAGLKSSSALPTIARPRLQGFNCTLIPRSLAWQVRSGRPGARRAVTRCDASAQQPANRRPS